jgi:hypothetical protein
MARVLMEIIGALTFGCPSPGSRYLSGDAAFIQEDQLFRRNLADLLEKFLPS